MNPFVVVSRLQALGCRSQAEGAAISGMKAESQWPVAGSNEFLEMAAGFCKAPEYALSLPGPHLIDALVPESLSGARRKILPWLLRSLPNLPRPVALALKRKIAP